MCSPSAPPAPDYTGAANAQGAANLEAARAQGHINNPNVIGPTGTQSVTWNGDDPTLHQTLNPQEQAIYDANASNRLGLAGLAGQGTESLKGLIGSNVDFSGAPGAATAYKPGDALTLSRTPDSLDQSKLAAMPGSSQQIRDQVVNAMMSRANTDIDRRQEQTKSDLIAQGIRPGTEAYSREMQRVDQSRNDAEQQAITAADQAAKNAYSMDLSTRQQGVQEQGQQFGQELAGGAQNFQQQGQRSQLTAAQQAQSYQQQQDARRAAIAEMLAQRQIPLNEITALMSGSQVNNPFSMPGYSQNGQVAPAPIFGAANAAGQYGTDAYNQRVGSNNSMMSGLFGLGSSAIGAWG